MCTHPGGGVLSEGVQGREDALHRTREALAPLQMHVKRHGCVADEQALVCRLATTHEAPFRPVPGSQMPYDS